MNFYAHAVAASWTSIDPAFVLGAMLPDFATMARIRLPEVHLGALADGVSFHHTSDRAFHRLRRFRDEEAWTLAHLLTAGLRRGPARGIAHVGVELSLDGALVQSSDVHNVYVGAIAHAHHCRIEWEDEASAERFAQLARRLGDFGVPRGYRDPSTVADRLVRILRPRPLLRLSDEETPILHSALPVVHERVHAASESIMSDLRREL